MTELSYFSNYSSRIIPFGDPLGSWGPANFDSVALDIRFADGVWPFGALIIILIKGREEC